MPPTVDEELQAMEAARADIERLEGEIVDARRAWRAARDRWLDAIKEQQQQPSVTP